MTYKIQTPAGPVTSDQKGEFAGHRKTKIYGRMNCPSALAWIKRGFHVKHRVFFFNEKDAVACGYRPCARCMRIAYQRWKVDQL